MCWLEIGWQRKLNEYGIIALILDLSENVNQAFKRLSPDTLILL